MNTQQRIQELEAELRELRLSQDRCSHIWRPAVYDAEMIRQGYGSKLVGHGSDVYYEYAGYEDVRKDRWSRTCETCGKKEYTYKQEVTHTEYKPKF